VKLPPPFFSNCLQPQVDWMFLENIGWQNGVTARGSFSRLGAVSDHVRESSCDPDTRLAVERRPGDAQTTRSGPSYRFASILSTRDPRKQLMKKFRWTARLPLEGTPTRSTSNFSLKLVVWTLFLRASYHISLVCVSIAKPVWNPVIYGLIYFVQNSGTRLGKWFLLEFFVWWNFYFFVRVFLLYSI